MRRLNVAVIGAGGTIGRAVAAALAERHAVFAASRGGAWKVDLGEPASIDALFDSLPALDAVVCCAASVPLAALDAVSDEAFAQSLRAKLFGQVALARRAAARLRDGGAIALTGGRFDGPLPGGTAGALANAGLEAFVAQAAAEMPRGLRINAVSPGWVQETLDRLGRHAERGIPARALAQVYVSAVEGTMSGKTLAA